MRGDSFYLLIVVFANNFFVRHTSHNREWKALQTFCFFLFQCISWFPAQSRSQIFPLTDCPSQYLNETTKLCTEVHLKECFALVSAVKIRWYSGLPPLIDPTAMPCWWAPIRAKQMSMAASAGVIWLSACVRYWPYRGVGTCASVNNLIVSEWNTLGTNIKMFFESHAFCF